MFSCDAIKSLQEETGDMNLRPQALILDNGHTTCGGFTISSPYHDQCRNCADFFINNIEFQCRNPQFVSDYTAAYHRIKKNQLVDSVGEVSGAKEH